MSGKYCRICWNSAGWVKPTGEAQHLETNSFVVDYGYGHEEWLFRFDWLLDGYRWGFLQPIGKFRDRLEGESLPIFLYAYPPLPSQRDAAAEHPIPIATIRQVEILTRKQASRALRAFRTNGWLEEMRADVRSLGLDDDSLAEPGPFEVVNIRFKPEDVRFFTKRTPLSARHVAARVRRYQPLNWNGRIPAELNGKSKLTKRKLKSEEDRERSGHGSTTFEPRHDILQNRLLKYLTDRFGAASVGYEEDRVDLTLLHEGKTTFFEVKTYNTVRECVRWALGQLLEYAHRPAKRKAEAFVVVGEAVPSQDDVAYLTFLRDTYGLPVSYLFFDLDKARIGMQVPAAGVLAEDI